MSVKRIQPGFVLVLLLVFVITMSFYKMNGGTVRGTVTPPEAGLKAFLFSRKDTIAGTIVNGAFQFSNIAVGSYKLLVEAAPPYRNGIKEGILVTEGGFTDAGQLELQK
jgi:hypothetical protein